MLDSITPEVQAEFISCDSAKKLWDAICRNYSSKGDKSKIIDLITRSFTLKQDDKDVLSYANELRDIYTKLDYCYPPSIDPVA